MGAGIALSMGLNENVFGPDGEFDACPGDTPRTDVVVSLSGCHYECEGQTFAFDPQVYDWTYGESELVLVVGTEDDVCEAWKSQDAVSALRDDIVDDQWLTLPDEPAGMTVVHGSRCD